MWRKGSEIVMEGVEIVRGPMRPIIVMRPMSKARSPVRSVCINVISIQNGALYSHRRTLVSNDESNDESSSYHIWGCKQEKLMHNYWGLTIAITRVFASLSRPL